MAEYAQSLNPNTLSSEGLGSGQRSVRGERSAVSGWQVFEDFWDFVWSTSPGRYLIFVSSNFTWNAFKIMCEDPLGPEF